VRKSFAELGRSAISRKNALMSRRSPSIRRSANFADPALGPCHSRPDAHLGSETACARLRRARPLPSPPR
jgi:hypothetical protein